MSQEVQADQYFWEISAHIANTRKVFITSGDHAHCAALLDGGAVELVCIGEESPLEGVKARADFRERRSSKDLIIDAEGVVSLEVASKLLKKGGAFMSLAQREWDDSFPEVYAVAWVEAEGDEARQMLSYVNADAEEALFWVASRSVMPELPEVERARPLPEVDESAELLSEARAEIAELTARLKKTERSRSATQTHYRKTKEQLKSVEAQQADLTAQLNEALETLSAREGAHDEATRRVQALQDQETKLKRDLKEQRAELTSLKQTVTAQERSLALNISTAQELEESRAAQSVARGAYETVADAWSSWLGEGLAELPARPPASSLSLVEGWSSQLLAMRPMVTATLSEYQEISDLRVTLGALRAELEEVITERDEARSSLAELRAAGGADGDQLRESLSAERALRVAQERELAEHRAQIDAYQAELSEARSALDVARRVRSAGGNASSDEARLLLLEAQVKAQEGQRKARERLMQVNHQLQLDLTSQLENELSARAELQARLEVAERQLRELDVERRFPSAKPVRDERREGRGGRQENRRSDRRDDRRGPRQDKRRDERRDERQDKRQDKRRDDRQDRRRDRSAERAPARPTRAPARSAEQRLGALSDQLKRGAKRQAEQVSESQAGSGSVEATVELNTHSKQDQKRIRRQAKALKKRYSDSVGPAPVSASTSKASPAPVARREQSAEERQREVERAHDLLKSRLKSLHRRGS